MYRGCFQHLSGIERRRIPPTPEGHLRLHRLERPVQWPAELMEAIWSAQKPINFYPDYVPFYGRLAEFIGQPKERIVVGQGIEGLVRDLIMLSCGPGDVFAFTWPTCAMFDLYAEVFGARPARIVAEPVETFGADELLSQLPEEARLLLLPNPGQPVETYLPPSEMRRVAAQCRAQDAVLAIDEAYFGFGAETCLPLIEEFENVVVLRTLSKAFGAAGIRVGFAVGSEKAIRPLNAVRASGEVSGPSLTAATVLMDHWSSHVEPGIKEICRGRDWIKEELKADGYKVRGSVANHVMIDMGSVPRAALVARRLSEGGVHVRTNVAPLDRYLLVTCGPVEMMRQFQAAFYEAV